MHFTLNTEYTPGDNNEERFDLIDGIEGLRDNARVQLKSLADLQNHGEWSMAAHALSAFMKYGKLLDKMYPDKDGKLRTTVEYGSEAVQEVQALVNKASNPELSKQDGHVTQVWYDGEVTSQKSGDLLWQRSIHATQPGFRGVDFPIEWPDKTIGDKGYVFCNGVDAIAIHRKILKHTMDAILK